MVYKIVKVILYFYYFILKRTEIIGKENIPDNGAVIICSNHTALFDPSLIAICTKRELNFMAKKELFDSKIGRWFFTRLHAFPVNRNGDDLPSVRKSLTILKSGGVLVIFPEGTREKTHERLEFKAGASILAVRTKAPVVPAYISGSHKPFKKVTIKFGELIDFSLYDKNTLSKDDYSNLSNELIATKIFEMAKGE